MMLSAALALPGLAGQPPAPASQNFLQEMSSGFSGSGGMPAAPVQLLDYVPPQSIRALVSGSWLEFSESGWHTNLLLQQTSLDQFTFSGATSQPTTAPVPWHEVRQLKRAGTTAFVATATQLLKCTQAKCEGIDWPADRAIRQIAVSPEGQLAVASAKGLFESTRSGWVRAEAAR
jgi:hypothetical protein